MSHDAGHAHGPTCGGTSDAAWLDRIRWDENGLVPAIAQDGSYRWATVGSVRSMARVYCTRSLVPMDRKSKCRRNSGAVRAAAGISIIAPTAQGPCACPRA